MRLAYQKAQQGISGRQYGKSNGSFEGVSNPNGSGATRGICAKPMKSIGDNPPPPGEIMLTSYSRFIVYAFTVILHELNGDRNAE